MKKFLIICLLCMVITSSVFAAKTYCFNDRVDNIPIIVMGDRDTEVILGGAGTISSGDNCRIIFSKDVAVLSVLDWNSYLEHCTEAELMLESGDKSADLTLDLHYGDLPTFEDLTFVRLVSFLLENHNTEALALINDSKNNILAFHFYLDSTDFSAAIDNM